MSLKALEWIATVSTGTSSSKHVLTALANFHQEKTGLCCPSKPTLRAFTELNEKTIKKHIEYLEAAGFLTVESRPGTSPNYRLNFEVTTSKIGGGKAGNNDNLINVTTSKFGGGEKLEAPSKIGEGTTSNFGGGNSKPTPSKFTGDPLQIYREPPPNLETERENGINGIYPPPTVPPSNDGSLVLLPTNRFHHCGEEWPVPQALIDSYIDAYPNLDVPIELQRIRAHFLGAEPSRRRLAGEIPKFINNWLQNRDRDRLKAEASDKSQSGGKSTRQRSIEDDLNDTSWAGGGTG